MTLWHVGIFSAVIVIAASEAVPDGSIDPIARLGAVAALGTALLLMLYRTIPTMTRDFRESLDKICKRHDEWEKIRHEDHEQLRDVLQSLRKDE